jgi:hypothetical protein
MIKEENNKEIKREESEGLSKLNKVPKSDLKTTNLNSQPKHNIKRIIETILIVFLIIGVIVLAVLFIRNYPRNDVNFTIEHPPQVKILGNGFEVESMKYDTKNLSVTIKRLGGIEDYQGFQIFLEDSYGKIKSEIIYTNINLNEVKEFNVNYNKKLADVKYATLNPIF